MLPKRLRATKQTIEKHLIRARRLKTSRFLVLYAVVTGFSGPQVSVTVSKKVAPTAVLRNKLRRRGYSALLPLIPHISTSAAILVSYSKADTKVSIPELTEELQEAFKAARIYIK